jgi:hypothetical protein
LGRPASSAVFPENDDILDIQMHLKKVDGWEPGEGLLFEMHFDKVRHAARLASGYHVGLEGGQWIRKEPGELAEVRALLDQGKTEREVAKELGIDKSKVHRLKKKVGLAKLNQSALPQEP